MSIAEHDPEAPELSPVCAPPEMYSGWLSDGRAALVLIAPAKTIHRIRIGNHDGGVSLLLSDETVLYIGGHKPTGPIADVLQSLRPDYPPHTR